jgi:hypothetical protein
MYKRITLAAVAALLTSPAIAQLDIQELGAAEAWSNCLGQEDWELAENDKVTDALNLGRIAVDFCRRRYYMPAYKNYQEEVSSAAHDIINLRTIFRLCNDLADCRARMRRDRRVN